MKRKRKSGCPSPLLDDSPKRTKVHAQRKFAQGSNVNSPVLTPIRELESDIPKIDVLPEPVELLPIKRPNTEDFLTFLCFRGTPILPPSLNFFNTASIVDTNGQVHEIKSECSPKNGPIDIAKCGTSSEKPFIAFGVRKRADPIVISRQMDRKRRHALAIQALRRKYQEQKMAKIRALTISKLSEKVTNKTLVRTNTVSKTETVTKKSNTLQKTRVVATKHVKVTTQTLKTTLRRPKIKPKMCLRSFRGRFVQKELPFRRQMVKEKALIRKPLERKIETKKKMEKTELISEEVEPSTKQAKPHPVFRVNRRITTGVTLKTSPRVTRSGILDKKADARRKQIKKRILMTDPNTLVKPRSLRLTTLKKTVLSQKKCKSVKAKRRLRAAQRHQNTPLLKQENTEEKIDVKKSFQNIRRNIRTNEKKDIKDNDKKTQDKCEEVGKITAIKKDYKKITDFKKETNTFNVKDKKHTNKSIDIKKEITKSTDIKKDVNKTVEIKKSSRISNIVQKKEINMPKAADKSDSKSSETKTGKEKPTSKSAGHKKGLMVDNSKRTSKKENRKNCALAEGLDEIEEVAETNTKKIRSKSQEQAKNISETDGRTFKKDLNKTPDSKKSKGMAISKMEKESVDLKKTMIESTDEEILKKSPRIPTNKKNITKEATSSNKKGKSKLPVTETDINPEDELKIKESVSTAKTKKGDNKKSLETKQLAILQESHVSTRAKDEIKDNTKPIQVKGIESETKQKRKKTTASQKEIEAKSPASKVADIDSDKKIIVSTNIKKIKATDKSHDKTKLTNLRNTKEDIIKKTTNKKNQDSETSDTQHQNSVEVNFDIKDENKSQMGKEIPKRLKVEPKLSIDDNMVNEEKIINEKKFKNKSSTDNHPENVKSIDIVENKTDNSNVESLDSEGAHINKEHESKKDANEMETNILVFSDKEGGTIIIKELDPPKLLETKLQSSKNNDRVEHNKNNAEIETSFIQKTDIMKKQQESKPMESVKTEDENIKPTALKKNSKSKLSDLEDVMETEEKQIKANTCRPSDDRLHEKVDNDKVDPLTTKFLEEIGKTMKTEHQEDDDDELEDEIVETNSNTKNLIEYMKMTNASNLRGKALILNPPEKDIKKGRFLEVESEDKIEDISEKPATIGKSSRKSLNDTQAKNIDMVITNNDFVDEMAKESIEIEKVANLKKSGGNDKDDVCKKVLTKTNTKTVKGKLIKSETLEDVEDLISITNKMKNLETRSDSPDVRNESDSKNSDVKEKPQEKDNNEIPMEESNIAPVFLVEDTPKKGVLSTCKSRKENLKKDIEKMKVVDKAEAASSVITQRPTRKSKEAAAIYMEILSHKLVNDNKVDDDNVSIDSFPELPNVKKTEQRENELKAQAKTSKDECKEKSKETDKKVESPADDKDKHDKTNNDEKNGKQSIKQPPSEKSIICVNENDLLLPEDIPDDIKLNELKSKLENVHKLDKNAKKPNVTGTKRKSPGKKITAEGNESPRESESDERIRDAKLRKSDSFKQEENEDNNSTRRQTRNSSQNKTERSDDSDESFHIDVRIPRKKQITRSKVIPKLAKPPAIDIPIEKTKEKVSSSDSDQSTTSDMNLQTLANKAKNKKYSKTKSMKRTDKDFSDSDEEPLSKLTNQSVVGSQKSGHPIEKTKEGEASKIFKAISPPAKLSPKPVEIVKTEPKPKRECAKIPQNYLPMLSSSDEDEIFHGFDEKNVKNTKSIAAMLPACTHTPPLLDLLHKDLGKRFGKEKVNMSNEQIEKWLKDSALAGSSIKKENDEMLKFGERIPTESTLDTPDSVDTEKLKLVLLNVSKPGDKKANSDIDSSNTTPVKVDDQKVEESGKPQIDRKLIFRKCKKDTIPNINAFSPENESSVYAFGEENEDVISTPFRRPSRRPSSTATSRSEDESSRNDDSLKVGQFRKPTSKQDISRANKEEPDITTEPEESSHFYIPQKPSKHGFTKLQNKTLKKSKSNEKLSESDDFKYKIPSSPSASSSSSAKLYKKPAQKQKTRPAEFISPIYTSDFPKKTDPAKLVEAPLFQPTDQEFQDPLEYIERIRHKAEQFGICRIVPPSSFKPECKVTDDMRFTAYDQYVHKMLHRWGPNFKELMAIKKYLETQNISLIHPPWIGGMEIDLPRLYQTVQTLGGLKEVIEKKKWPRVSELMKIPKSAQDRVTKLDDIYCKYLLPYDTLSPAEREKLFDEVDTEWAKRESKSLMRVQGKSPNVDAATDADSEDLDDNDVGECITKGRNMALNAFYRIARNTMSMHFKTNEPLAQEVEQEYWKHVIMRQNHICVHSGSIDCGNWGYGFAISKNSPFARHSWNLKVLTNNNGSVLRSLGPIMGVTVPTLHVGMVFSACCWYRDPHGLPWIEYLHTGGNKIWYGIPNSASEAFQSTLRQLVPNYCRNKELWLPSDTVMVPPSLLVENNVSLCRTVQEPGQFIVVFPKAFTSSISTGYVVSESVYFAPTYWLKTGRALFDALRNSSEPSMFSLDRLLLSITTDARCSADILRQVLPHVQELCDREKQRRDKLRSLGDMTRERLPIPEVNRGRKKKFQQGEEGDYECEVCKMSLFVSMVFDTQEGLTYCLDHGIEMTETQKIPVANCKFMFTYDDDELANVPDKMKATIEMKLQKKVPNKYAGMPTMLGRMGNQ